MIKVSIIIPIYNVAPYLEKCLDSLIKLGDRVAEMLCVNDGSTDNSEAVVVEYMKRDSRVTLISKENGGLCSARNRGLNQAKGNYIVFVDGDDYVIPSEFEKMLDQVEEAGSPDGIWTGYVRKDWNGIHNEDTKLNLGMLNSEEIRTQYLPAMVGISMDTLNGWLHGKHELNSGQEFPTVWRGMYSKHIIDEFGIRFDERVKTGEDVLFNMWFYSCAENMLVAQVHYYCYVWRKGSLTQTTVESFYVARKKFIEGRKRLNAALIEKGLIDLSPYYQGALILTKVQMAITLSDCKWNDGARNCKMFRDYASMEDIQSAYNRLKLTGVRVKYKLPLVLAKARMDRCLFLGCMCLNKMGMHIYPDE